MKTIEINGATYNLGREYLADPNERRDYSLPAKRVVGISIIPLKEKKKKRPDYTLPVTLLGLVSLTAAFILEFACNNFDKAPVSAAVEAQPPYYTVRVVIPADTVSICTDFIPAPGATIQADQITGTVVSVRPLN